MTTLVNTGGDAVERYVYSPYGVLTIYDATWSNLRSASSYANAYTYTGRQLDTETGLYYFRARFLHAQLGRFTSRDAIQVDINLYRYVSNNPVLYRDPSGLAVGTEAGDLEILRGILDSWKSKEWSVAAKFLEFFMNHKNGSKDDVVDASGLPSVKNITESTAVSGPLHDYLESQATHAGTIAIDHNLGHWRSVPWEGEVFYAFGGFDLSVKGTLTVDEWGWVSRSWSFEGTARIDDTYTFRPDAWYRTIWSGYAAANDLEVGHDDFHYTEFKTKLKWDYSTSGCISLLDIHW